MKRYDSHSHLIGAFFMALFSLVFFSYAVLPTFSPYETRMEDRLISLIMCLIAAYVFMKFRKAHSQVREEEDNPLNH